MYEGFYGLTRTAFAVTPDPAMLYMSAQHREALATIIYGVETRKGFIVCTGEVGTGKSTIVRAFFDQTRREAVKLIYIFTPQVSPLEMAQYICRELDVEDPASIFAAVPRLQMKLLEVFESGKTVVLMIDEAQLLPPETLEFLRLLSNFETDTEKLIQIVLVGQPEVDTMLARRDMRQVNQRVALRARLGALSIEESFDYITHRLRVSGAGDTNQVMSPSAAWLIAEAGGGIPRVINILADNALIAGFGAAQRPLGSQLAGTTIREFIAKSGAAAPAPATGRFSAGWRAARRLRSALVRDRDEATEWLTTAPAAPAPVLSQPPRVAASQFIAPRAASPSNGAARSMSESEPERWQVSRIAQNRAPARAPEAVFIAPVQQPADDPRPAATPRAPGRIAPASIPPIVPPMIVPEAIAPLMIEPVFEAALETPVLSMEPPAAAIRALPVARYASAPLALGRTPPAVQWPALSRVRSGLQTVPRRQPSRR